MVVVNDSADTFRFNLNGEEKLYLPGHTYSISESSSYIDGLIAQGILRVKKDDVSTTENVKGNANTRS